MKAHRKIYVGYFNFNVVWVVCEAHDCMKMIREQLEWPKMAGQEMKLKMRRERDGIKTNWRGKL